MHDARSFGQRGRSQCSAVGPVGTEQVTVEWGYGTRWTREMGVLVHSGHGVLAVVMVYLAIGAQAKYHINIWRVLTSAVISHPGLLLESIGFAPSFSICPCKGLRCAPLQIK